MALLDPRGVELGRKRHAIAGSEEVTCSGASQRLGESLEGRTKIGVALTHDGQHGLAEY